MIAELALIISIHTPVKGVTSPACANTGIVEISIHTPVKGVTRRHPYWDLVENFNPHTREGCDPVAATLAPGDRISIHTPVKGVTRRRRQGKPDPQISIHTPVKGVTACDATLNALKDISIHTPVKGVTVLDRQLIAIPEHFNPHTREGCDDRLGLEGVMNRQISIHTPVKGVTRTYLSILYHQIVFQSTHP